MSKKLRLTIIITGLAMLLLTFGIGVPAIMADDSTPSATPPAAVVKQDGIIERVAAALNISSANLTQAVKQAAQEIKDTKPTDDAFYAKVAEILKIDKAALVAAIQQAEKDIINAGMESVLSKAVAKGTITDAEKAQIEAWFGQRPSAFDKLFNLNALHAFKGWGKAHSFFGKQGKQEPKGEHGKSVKPPRVTPTPTATANTTAYRLY